jgi:predicted deacylase
MNRIFPGSATGTITERLAHRLYEDVMVGADFALTLHGWTRGGMVTPYVEYPRAGDASPASRAAAMAFGLDWIEAFDWPSGMLAAVCARNGIPAIEPEIGGLECTTPERRALYKRGVRNLMHHLGLLASTPEIERTARDVTRAEATAPTGGVIHRRREIGDPVRTGDVIATISDLLGRPLAEAHATMSGFIAAQRLAAAVSPGEQIAVIFRAEGEEF